jgi:histidinol-phosphate aminotransferase
MTRPTPPTPPHDAAAAYAALVEPNIEALVPYEPGKPIDELRRELGLSQVVKLASNENPFGASPAATLALRGALDKLHLYPDPRAHGLRQALCERLGVRPDELLISNGSNEAINLIIETFRRPGAEALFPRCAFAVYRIGCQLSGVSWREVGPRDGRPFGIDLDALLEAVTPQTRFVLLDNPGNPTGDYVGEDALARFLSALPRHVIPVLDEAYREYATADDYPDGLTLRDLHPNLLISRTFSKCYGLAALRVGYTIGPAPLIGYVNRVRATFNVGTLGQVAALAALDDAAFVQQSVTHNAAEMARACAALDALRPLGVGWAPSQANFLLVSLPCDGRALFDRLLRRGVIVRPMAGYGLPRHVRVSIGLTAEMDAFLAALPACLAEVSPL